MPEVTVSEQMPVKSEAVFALLHDYDRRLEWDTLLREARLTRGNEKAEKGATSLCVGRPFFGIFGLETKYISFHEGKLAAVEMINRPPLFKNFAASIRHKDNDCGSIATYKLHFCARPRVFAVFLEPLMLRVLREETRKRLKTLSEFLSINQRG